MTRSAWADLVATMRRARAPRPRPGYAFTSSRRHPREPEIIVLSDRLDEFRYVGMESIDGREHFAWVDYGPPRRYLFQVAVGGPTTSAGMKPVVDPA